MFHRLTNKTLWIKVLAASLSTSLIIFISFLIRNFIKSKTKKLKSINQNAKYLALEFILIFLSSFLSYTIVYIVLGISL